MALWGGNSFCGEKHGVFWGRRYGWGMLGVPLKPQLALGMCENKGEAQSPLVPCESAPPLGPSVCQSLDFCPAIAVWGQPRCPARHPWGLWGVARHCLRSALWDRFHLGSCSCHGGAGLCSRCRARLEHYLILPSLSAFPVVFCSGAGGEGAGPGCLAVNDLDSKECSEQEQKGSRECSSADGR